MDPVPELRTAWPRWRRGCHTWQRRAPGAATGVRRRSFGAGGLPRKKLQDIVADSRAVKSVRPARRRRPQCVTGGEKRILPFVERGSGGCSKSVDQHRAPQAIRYALDDTWWPGDSDPTKLDPDRAIRKRVEAPRRKLRRPCPNQVGSNAASYWMIRSMRRPPLIISPLV